MTAEEVRIAYPEAAIEPVPETRKRMATGAEADELRALVAEVLREETNADREGH